MSRRKGDERPAALKDYAAAYCQAIDARLEAALNKIRADRNLPATQDSVKDLAGCSRGTVNNRPSVAAALRDIKSTRKKSRPAAKQTPQNALAT